MSLILTINAPIFTLTPKSVCAFRDSGAIIRVWVRVPVMVLSEIREGLSPKP